MAFYLLSLTYLEHTICQYGVSSTEQISKSHTTMTIQSTEDLHVTADTSVLLCAPIPNKEHTEAQYNVTYCRLS